MAQTQYIFLGFPQREDAPSPPAIPTIERSPFLTIKEDGANVTMMRLTSHTGTHMDAPFHVIAGGLTISDLDPGDFVFEKPYVIDLPLQDATVVQPKDLDPFIEGGQEADLLLVRFGYGPIRRADPDRYSMKSPGFGVDSAAYMRRRFPRLRGLGMDVPSLSCIEYLEETMAAHHELLGGEGRRFIVIEDLNLEQDLSGLSRVIVAPLMVENMDGAPVTVIGERKAAA
jgi:kynurenine formamidase